MKNNYHTHTRRCNHADGSDEAYVLNAIQGGFTELGFSDHSPWPKHPFENQTIRMSTDELAEYVDSLKALQKRYGKQIKILIGMECEYYPDRLDYLRWMINTYDLDYVILGNHFHIYELRTRYYAQYVDREHLYQDYERDTIEALNTGLYDCLAHPDLFLKTNPEFNETARAMTKRILLESKRLSIPIEFNLGGIRNSLNRSKYPSIAFWQVVAEIGNEVVIGVDAHSPTDLSDIECYKEAEAFLKALNIEVIERFKMRKEK